MGKDIKQNNSSERTERRDCDQHGLSSESTRNLQNLLLCT